MGAENYFEAHETAACQAVAVTLQGTVAPQDVPFWGALLANMGEPGRPELVVISYSRCVLCAALAPAPFCSVVHGQLLIIVAQNLPALQ